MAGIMHSIVATLGGSSGLSIFVDTTNVNVHDMLIANGWDGISVVNPIITVGSGVKIWSTSTGIAAFDSGTLPAGSTLTIYNNGVIVGRGGNGGNAVSRVAPTDGGTGLRIRIATTITNLGGIAGGGGGGGFGGAGKAFGTTYPGSGGGGGIPYGAGGPGISGYNGLSATWDRVGGTFAGVNGGGTGGIGGTYGASGATGTNGNDTGGSAGGAGGPAVNGDSLITWAVLGTILGARIG